MSPSNGRRVLVTGGSGFTGRHVLPRLQAEGYEVIDPEASGRFDLTDVGALQAKVFEARPDYVIHLAALSFVAHGDPAAFYRVNAVGTTNLLDALVTLPRRPHRVIVASSANVYGNATDDPITERTPVAPVNHYAASKVAMEHLAAAYMDRLPICITRPFNYTGVGQRQDFLIPKLVGHFAARKPFIELGNYGFFNLNALCRLLQEKLDEGMTVVTVLHSTSDPVHAPHKRLGMLLPALQRCARVLVHSVGDLNRLKQLGVVDNAALFPHGIMEPPPGMAPTRTPLRDRGAFTIASYGFFLPHKGLLELIEALALLRDRGLRVRLKMVNAEYPVDSSKALIASARRRIFELDLANHVELYTDFLSDEESFRHLSEADLLVFPYQRTGESASGAVRYGLATGIPVAVTPLPIFEDVASVVSSLPGFTPSEIAGGISDLLEGIAADPQGWEGRSRALAAWRDAHAYSRLGRRLHGMLSALRRQGRKRLELEHRAETEA